MNKEKEEKYIITYVINGKEETIERVETHKELKDRIECYKRNNMEIKSIIKEVVIVQHIQILY